MDNEERKRLFREEQQKRLRQQALVPINPPSLMEEDMAKTSAQRVREYRERQREAQSQALQKVLVQVPDTIRHVTPPVPLQVTPVTPQEPIAARVGRGAVFGVLTLAALALAGTGIVINAWYARSLGSTPLAGWLFLAVGVTTDAAALTLPTIATMIQSRARACAAWALWALTFAFALSASLGFASVNITDTRLARTLQSNDVLATVERELARAESIADAECRRVGPICQQRRNEVVAKQAKRDQDQSKIVADPQVESASRLVRWISGGHIAPSGEDVGMFRLVLMTLLPQLGGLLLMVARR